jgi:hypothetical protein
MENLAIMLRKLNLNMQRLRTILIPVILVSIGMVAGSFIQNARQARPAESALYDGFNNLVFEVGPSGTTSNPVLVFTEPSADSQQIDRLLWGDRVLWRGSGFEQQDSDGNRWAYVSLSEGVSGWIIANIEDQSSGRLLTSEATYTTPGIEVGATIQVTTDGAGANFRSAPSVSAERLRGLQAGETLEVVSGPYQNELFVWWQYRDSGGNLGWVVDIQNWFVAQ